MPITRDRISHTFYVEQGKHGNSMPVPRDRHGKAMSVPKDRHGKAMPVPVHHGKHGNSFLEIGQLLLYEE